MKKVFVAALIATAGLPAWAGCDFNGKTYATGESLFIQLREELRRDAAWLVKSYGVTEADAWEEARKMDGSGTLFSCVETFELTGAGSLIPATKSQWIIGQVSGYSNPEKVIEQYASVSLSDVYGAIK